MVIGFEGVGRGLITAISRVCGVLMVYITSSSEIDSKKRFRAGSWIVPGLFGSLSWWGLLIGQYVEFAGVLVGWFLKLKKLIEGY